MKWSILSRSGAAIISEIKFASPSKGMIRKKSDLPIIAKAMEDAGVIGISILTEPNYFGGDLNYIAEVRSQSKLPILMKDFVLRQIQIDAAAKVGASVILLIQALYDRGYGRLPIAGMIDYAHSKGVEVLLEVHSSEEFQRALGSEADFIGINNRDLKSLDVDIQRTKLILNSYSSEERIIVSESGVDTKADIAFLKACGAHAFLIGTSIMKAPDIKTKIEGLVGAV
jgi:indole-3-glycerol phosphate synthase